MNRFQLIMPMAGRGSRFAREGIRQPKPLVPLEGMPFFWWAVESVRRAAAIERMIFVVLQEHVAEWKLDRCIQDFYPEAEIVAIPEVTAGSAETAALGAAAASAELPIVINDCDHAFLAPPMDDAACRLQRCAAMLMTFRSQSPNYSYVRLGPMGEVTGTVEKQVVSDFAIAGCYLFRSPGLFLRQFQRYVQNCPYSELFISGLYNQMLAEDFPVERIELEEHFAFGTPDEYASVQPRLASRLAGWR